MMKRHILDTRGFSLIELLIVMAMLALVLVAIYSLYDTHSKSAYVQEEVVDVQQNLRIALDGISRDIKMAGVLIPMNDNAGTGTNVENVPVGNVGNNTGNDAGSGVTDTMTLNAASATGQYGRIDLDCPGGTTITLKLDSSDAVSTFSVGNTVRIIRPPERTDPAGPNGAIFQVAGLNPDPAVRTITLTQVSGDDPTGKTFNKGDMVTGTASNALYPNSIGYIVTSGGNCPANLFCLSRQTNAGTGSVDTQVIATNITNLQFRYILDTNAETDAPVDLAQIRAVRVTITGQTVATQVQSGGPKTKQITSVVKVRNR